MIAGGVSAGAVGAGGVGAAGVDGAVGVGADGVDGTNGTGVGGDDVSAVVQFEHRNTVVFAFKAFNLSVGCCETYAWFWPL